MERDIRVRGVGSWYHVSMRESLRQDPWTKTFLFGSHLAATRWAEMLYYNREQTVYIYAVDVELEGLDRPYEKSFHGQSKLDQDAVELSWRRGATDYTHLIFRDVCEFGYTMCDVLAVPADHLIYDPNAVPAAPVTVHSLPFDDYGSFGFSIGDEGEHLLSTDTHPRRLSQKNRVALLNVGGVLELSRHEGIRVSGSPDRFTILVWLEAITNSVRSDR